MQNPLASGFRRRFCTSRPHDMFCFGHASARITFDVLQSAACGLVFTRDGVSTEDVFVFNYQCNKVLFEPDSFQNTIENIFFHI